MKPSFCAHCIDRPPIKKVGRYWLCKSCAALKGRRLFFGPASGWPSTDARRGARYGGGGYLPTADEQIKPR